MTNTLELFNSNKKLVKAIINKCRYNTFSYKTYLDWNEIEQVGLIALWQAIEKYDKDKGTFKNYAITAITRAIYRTINKQQNFENEVDIDTMYSLEAEPDELDDKIEYNKKINILNEVIDTLDCTDKSKQILKLRLQDYSILEIAKTIGNITYQGVYDIIKRYRAEVIDKFNRRYNNANRK